MSRAAVTVANVSDPWDGFPDDELDPRSRVERQLTARSESDLGTVVAVLDGEGRYADGDVLELARLGWDVSDDNFSPRAVTAVIEVEPVFYRNLPDDLLETTYRVLGDLLNSDTINVHRVRVVPRAAPEGWRTARLNDRDVREGGENQGVFPINGRWIVLDRLRILDGGEASMYRALKRRQLAMDPDRTIGIIPGSGFRSRVQTFFPDFVVTFRGRAAGIEVDGPHHSKRYAADVSRDRLLQDAGLSFVDRIVVEDTNDEREVDDFVERFLRRLEK